MSNNNDRKPEILDLDAILATYRKHWWWFLVSVVICMACAYVYVKTHNTEYRVSASVVINGDDQDGMGGTGSLGSMFGQGANAEDEIFIINSHTVLRDAAKQLGLNRTHTVKSGLLTKYLAYPDFPVDVYPAPGIEDTLRTSLLFDITAKNGKADIEVKSKRSTLAEIDGAKLPATVRTPYGVFVVNTTPTAPKDEEVHTFVTVSGYDGAAEDLALNTFADRPSKRTNVLDLGIVTSNIEYGKDVLDEIIRQYNQRGIAVKNIQAQKTAEFIDQRLALISGDLQEAEEDIQDYKERNGLVDVGSEASYNMSRRGHGEAALADAQTRSEIIKMTRDFIANPANKYELIPLSGNLGGAEDQISTYNSLVLNRMNLVKTAKPGNIALRDLDEHIDAMRATIDTSLDRAYQTSLVNVREARAQVAAAQSKLGGVPVQERQYVSLQRQQNIKQRIYLFLLQRREENAISLANATPKSTIIDNAFALTDPVSTGKKVIFAIALVLGLMLPAGALYIMLIARKHFETAAEFRKLTDVPVLGEMTVNTTGNNLVALPGATGPVIELFNAMRTALVSVLASKPHPVVLVTSTRSGEGKTFVSANLAAVFAHMGKKVLLIGMDVRSPRLAQYMHLHPAGGLTTWLANPGTDPDRLLTPVADVPGLQVIAAGPVPPNPSELLSSTAVKKLIDDMRTKFDIIFIDSAPVGMVSDTFNLAYLADATVYVTRAKYTTKQDVAFMQQVHDEKRLNGIYAVVNGTTAKKGYGYGYGHGRDNGKND